jgi:hypothetical protein
MFEIFVAILCMALQVLDRREIVGAYIVMHMSDYGAWCLSCEDLSPGEDCWKIIYFMVACGV